MNTLLLTLAMGLSPAAAEPITLFDLTPALRFDAKDLVQVTAAWDLCHAVTTLQGIVNRSGPRLYIKFVQGAGKTVDEYWLDIMRRPGGWLAERDTRTSPDLPALIELFRASIKGVVVYDARVPATSNLASTIAGVEDLIAVRYDPAPGSLFSSLVTSGPRLPIVRRLLNDDGSPMLTGKGTIPGTDLPSTGSAKCDAYVWLRQHYLDAGRTDPHYLAFYLDAYWLKKPALLSPNQHTLTNHDFFVARRALFFDLNCWADETPIDDRDQPLGTDLKTLESILRSAYDRGGREEMIHIGGFTPWAHKYTTWGEAGGKHEPVPTEWEFSRVFSAYNAFVDADAIGLAAMANASFYMHFPLKEHYPQKWTTARELQARGLLTADGKVNFDGRDFIIFYVGDFDAAAWVYQWMPGAWQDPARGKLPLMWCISPVLERRAAPMLDYLRRTATPNDYFAAADNGAGYLNPGMLQEPRPISDLPCGLNAWAEHCLPFYKRWDLTVTGFVIDGYAPGLTPKGLDCYARFSPNGIVPQKITPTLLHKKMPVIRADFDLPDDAAKAAGVLLERVKVRTLPFHWFRAVLKGPSWYLDVYTKVRAANPKIELLDAPAFFELYRLWLEQNPDAAAGRLPL